LNCPFCSFEGPPRGLHAHLGEQHPDAVRFEDRSGRSFYSVTCPICGDGYEREIKPRGRDPGFVDEFSTQIRLVAMDMLVNHLMGEHEELEIPEGDEPDEPQAEAPLGEAGPVPAWLAEARQAKQQNGA
jgi:hypothetical protein